MIVTTSDLFVEDVSGAELRVDADYAKIAYVTSNGEVGEFSSSEVPDLFASDRISYFLIPEICILLISELGKQLYRFFLGQAVIEQISSLKRFDPMCEGFDYCIWIGHGSGPALCYELGIYKFNSRGQRVWQTCFDEIHTMPEVLDEYLVYHENEGDITYSLVDGSIT